MTTQVWRSVSSLWVGGDLTWLEKLCLSSFAKKGFEVRLYSYEPLEAPPGVSLQDANTIVPESQVFRNPPPSTSYAGFSNVFRYALLAERPHEVWIDTDVLALDNPLPNSTYVLGFENKSYVNGAVLRLPTSSPLLHNLRAEVERIDTRTFTWGDLGPKLITAEINKLGLHDKVSPRSAFYELTATEAWKFFSPRHTSEVSRRVAMSSVAHIWNEALKLAPFKPKDFSPNPNSFLGLKLQQLQIDSVPTNVLSDRNLRSWALRSRMQALRNQLGHLAPSGL